MMVKTVILKICPFLEDFGCSLALLGHPLRGYGFRDSIMICQGRAACIRFFSTLREIICTCRSLSLAFALASLMSALCFVCRDLVFLAGGVRNRRGQLSR